jgi:hypothetical protein
MAAGGFKEFIAGSVLEEDDINDFLMQGMLVFAGTAARGSAITSPVEGQFCFLKDSDTVEFYNGTAWAPFTTGLSYATIGTAATGSFTDGGVDYDYWDFTGNGSLVIDEGGVLDILVVGGGGGLGDDSNVNGGGGAGGVRYGTFEVTAGTVTVTVGAGGAGAAFVGSPGSGSSFGSYLFAGGGGFGVGMNSTYRSIIQTGVPGSQGGVRTAGGAGVTPGGGSRGTQGGGANVYDGTSLNFTGSSIEYGVGGRASASPVANTGTGSATGSSSTAGRVVVKVRK